MSGEAKLSAPRRVRVGAAALVALLHVLVVLALIRAFAPDFAHEVTRQVTSAFTVTVSTPPPSPSPTPSPAAPEPKPAGAAGEAGKRGDPREVSAPRPKLVIARPTPAPPVAATGADNTAGARDAGQGTGAGGQGSGTGSGAGGSGQGGGMTAKAVLISGDINSARDYPRESRELRLGGHVDVALTVGTDGRVRTCRVLRASRDPQADQITCRLAVQRFRFRPATSAAGEPVESVYGWRQRWFYPAEKK